MKSNIVRWIVTFYAALGVRSPRRLFPRSWSGVLDRAEAEDRELEHRLRAPISTETIPDSLHADIDRVLRYESDRGSEVALRIPTVVFAAAAAAVLLALGGLWIYRTNEPTANPVAVAPHVETADERVSTVAIPADLPPAIASIPADWEGLLREEKERIAADGINAIRFVAANFVPEPFMDEVDSRLDRWEAQVIPNR
jgi:hypothetical protein